MNRSIAAAAMLLALLLSFAPQASADLDTFASGSSGWQISLMDSNGYSWSTGPVYSSSGGNPGGCISSGVIGAGPDSRLYSFDASSSPFGDLAGKTLTFDIKVSGTATTPAGPAIARLYIGEDSSDYFMTTNAYSASLSAGGWISYNVPVVASNFMAWPGQTGKASFASVAANAVWVGLVFTSTDFSAADDALSTQGLNSPNGAVVSLDNIGTPSAVPIPCALMLLGGGLASIALIEVALRLLPARLQRARPD
jgi:hypothetical protein